MLVLGGLARDHGEAAGPVERALESGAAAERFARMVAALGGRAISWSARTGTSPRRRCSWPSRPRRAGVVARVDARRSVSR